MTQAFVYKWTHLPSMMYYIGSRTAKGCHPGDGYICSSKKVKPMIVANPQDWQREIIFTGTPLEMRAMESEILELVDAKNDPRSFNRHNGNGMFGNTGYIMTEDHKRKISETNKQVMSQPEMKEKQHKSHKGKKTNRVPKTAFKSGYIPWNKGKKMDPNDTRWKNNGGHNHKRTSNEQ